MFVPMLVAIRKERSSRSVKMKIEMQEQELKTLRSYYMDLRQVYSLIIFSPNNIYFTLACIELMGTYCPYCLSMSLSSRVTFIKSFG